MSKFRILDKYFLREFCRPLLLCLGVFLLCDFVWDQMDNFSDFLEAGEWGQVIKYYLVIVPAWIVELMPLTLLLALLYTLADMSKSGELIALRATGQDLYRLMIPIFFLVTFLTAGMLVLNVNMAPRARIMAKGIHDNLAKEERKTGGTVRDIFFKSLQANRAWYIEKLNMRTHEAFNVDLVESDDEGHDIKKYVAERAAFSDGHWKLFNVIVYDMRKKDTDPKSTRVEPVLDLVNVKDDPDKFQMKLKKPKYMLSTELSLALHLDKTMPKLRRSQYLTELYQRFSFPFSNMVVILFGIPFGIMPNRRSAFLAVTNALAIFIAYLVTSKLFITLGENGQLPALLASWLPNVVFAALGVYLIRGVR